MKKILFLLLILSWGLTQNFAISAPLDFHAGLNFSSTNLPSDTATGFVFGLGYQAASFNQFTVHPEINLLLPSGNVTYLSLPLLTRYYFATGMWRPYLTLGPSIGIKLTGATFKGFNAWIMGGGGLVYQANDSLGLILGLRYGLGLLDITQVGGDVKLNNFQVLFGASYEI